MKWVSHFFSPGSRQEVNSTWYPEIEEPIKSREKQDFMKGGSDLWVPKAQQARGVRG